MEINENITAKERIKKKLEDSKEARKNEREVFKALLETLNETGLPFTVNQQKRIACVGFEGGAFTVFITVENKTVIMHLTLPFRVKSSTMAIMSLYMAEINKDKAFSTIRFIDPEEGIISMDYAVMADDRNELSREQLKTYLGSFVSNISKHYVTLSHIAEGVIPEELRELYIDILTESLAVLKMEKKELSEQYGYRFFLLLQKMKKEIREIEKLEAEATTKDSSLLDRFEHEEPEEPKEDEE